MRSVEVILRELDKLLITEKEKGHSNVMGQTNVQKRPRSMELEC